MPWLFTTIGCESQKPFSFIDCFRLWYTSHAKLDDFNKGTHSFGGAFGRAIKRLSEQGFMRVKKISRKDTRIYPHFKLIRRKIERTKKRNLENRDSLSPLLLVRHKHDQINRRPQGLVESVPISERLSGVVGYADGRPNKII